MGQDAAGGEQLQHLLRRLVEALDADHERIAQRRRERAAPVEPGRQQLLGEQRVALAALVEARDELVLGRRAEDARELVGDLLAGQRVDVHAARVRRPQELGEQRAQRMAAVQLVRTQRRDDEHALAPQVAAQEQEERARRAVRPVDVLEADDERLLTRQPLEEVEQGLEQARLLLAALGGAGRLVAGRLAELGEQRCECRAGGRRQLAEDRVPAAHERPHERYEDRVGQLVLTELEAVGALDARTALAGDRREVVEQPGLPDARFAGHEGEARPALLGVGERRLELGELSRAPDRARA